MVLVNLCQLVLVSKIWKSAIQRINMTQYLRKLFAEDQGQDLIEYTLLMAFVALSSAALYLGAGGSISGIWSTSNSQLASASTQAS